jgi:hypothetical protein
MKATPQFAFSLEKCVVFDVECFPGRWMVGFYWPAPDGTFKSHAVDGDVGKLKTLLRQLSQKSRILVGYNSWEYDVPMLRAILGGRDAYETSHSIVHAEIGADGWKERIDLRDCPPLGVDHIDLCDRLKKNGKFDSLKTVAANLQRPRLRELPYPPEADLSDEQWAGVVSYNRIDLEHTWAVLEHYAPELEGMRILSDEFGIDLRSTAKSSSLKKIFKKLYEDAHDGESPPIPPRPEFVTYRPVAGVRRPRTPAGADWYDRVADVPIPVPPEGEILGNYPFARFDVGSITLKTGVGGLHSADGRGFFKTSPEMQLWEADVTSYYPFIIVTKDLFPPGYGDLGREAFRSILERRIALKKTATTAEDRLLQHGLKILLNAAFGNLNNAYSPLFHPDSFVGVTITGQLMLIDLIERLQAVDANIFTVNTDGLILGTRPGDERWRDAIVEW